MKNNTTLDTGDKQFLPVVTISTNTDYRRNLNKDSFARLMFNTNKEPLKYQSGKDILYISDTTTNRDIEYVLKLNGINQQLLTPDKFSYFTIEQIKAGILGQNKYNIIFVNNCEVQPNIELIKNLSKNLNSNAYMYINKLEETTKTEILRYFGGLNYIVIEL
jgi:hypothetical protein